MSMALKGDPLARVEIFLELHWKKKKVVGPPHISLNKGEDFGVPLTTHKNEWWKELKTTLEGKQSTES